MQMLMDIMRRAEGWDWCWWLDHEASAVINCAHRLGLVFRGSTTQVHWTERGVALCHRYGK